MLSKLHLIICSSPSGLKALSESTHFATRVTFRDVWNHAPTESQISCISAFDFAFFIAPFCFSVSTKILTSIHTFQFNHCSVTPSSQKKVMSKSTGHVCPHCKRDNFKSSRGLTQHLLTHSVCSQLERNKYAAGKKRSGNEAMLDDFEDRQRAASKEIASMLDEDERAREEILTGQKQSVQNHADTEDRTEDDADADGGNFVGGLDDDSSASEGMLLQDQDADDAADDTNVDATCRATLDAFAAYCAHADQHFSPLDKHQVRAIKLLRLLRAKKAPLDTYDKVQEWFLHETGVLQDHESLRHAGEHYIGRKSLMQFLKKRYRMEDKVSIPKPIILPSSKTKLVLQCYDAEAKVESILTDPRWTDDDWLFFDDDPLAPPPPELDYICDLNTGEAYIKTYESLIKDPTTEMLMGLPMYIDAAVTDQYGKLEVETLQFTLGILNRAARETRKAWRPLGYIGQYNKEVSRGKKMFLDTGHIGAYMLGNQLDDEEGENDGVEGKAERLEDYHAILSTILESYRQLQDKGMKWTFYYRGELYKDIALKFFIPFVKCDNEEADKLVAKYLCRTGNVGQICRYCTCPTQDSDLCLKTYPYKTEPMIKRLITQNREAELVAMSQKNIDNAFYGLRFGLHNKRGIHGACPLDMLHSMLLGVFKYIRECFFFQIGDTSNPAAEMNSLAKLFGGLFAHQSDHDLPRCNFANGITKGKLMAKEYTGVMLIIAVMLRSDLGRRILFSSRKGNFKQDWLIRDWSLLVETVLQWEAYLKSD